MFRGSPLRTRLCPRRVAQRSGAPSKRLLRAGTLGAAVATAHARGCAHAVLQTSGRVCRVPGMPARPRCTRFFRIEAAKVCFPVVPTQVRYARVYLRETTLISPFPVLLFGGDIEVQHRERLLSVDGWIYFQVRASAGVPAALKFHSRCPREVPKPVLAFVCLFPVTRPKVDYCILPVGSHIC